MTIYQFNSNGTDGSTKLINVLGGKGAGLCEMTALGIPVPSGFIIPTNYCMEYLNTPSLDKHVIINDVMSDVIAGIERLKKEYGYLPLLSVRSGARVSMPGMMDTILNVGLTKETEPFWEKRLGRVAMLDSKRRLMQMMGTTAYGLSLELFDSALNYVKGDLTDAEMTEEHLLKVIDNYCDIYSSSFSLNESFDIPLYDQLKDSITAVWNSWDNPRAKHYRQMHGYSDDWGTAVTIQAMVFGNMNDNSCSGVMFTRDPNTGAKKVNGEYLVNAQGEDVVAGIRTPEGLDSISKWSDSVEKSLFDYCVILEQHNKDMQDIEFTVEDGKVYILQTRNGKRSAQAAFKIAHDLYTANCIDIEEVFNRVSYKEYRLLQQPKIDPSFNKKSTGVGIPASGSIVSGIVALSAEFAINCTEPCIFVAKETTPDDIQAMEACVGILTQTGGATSHAAVVARGLNKTCVVGCTSLHPLGYGAWKLNDSGFKQGDLITIDGTTGNVWINVDVPVIQGSIGSEAKTLLSWINHTPDTMPRIHKHDGELIHVKQDTYIDTFDLDTVEEFDTMLSNLTIKKGATIFLDLSGKDALYEESDKDFIHAFGGAVSDTIITLSIKTILLNDVHSGLKNNTCLVLPETTNNSYASVLVSQGWNVLTVINTLADVLYCGGYVERGDDLETNIGSPELTKHLINTVIKSGKTFNYIATPISEQALIHKTLG